MPSLCGTPQIPYRILMRGPLSSCSSKSTGGLAMLDLIYLALGLGLFGLMQLYARWAAKA